MKNKKIVATLAGVMALTFALTACGAQGGSSAAKSVNLSTSLVSLTKATDVSKNPSEAINRKDTIIIGTQDVEGKFNLFYTVSTYEQYISETLFDELLETDGKGNPIKGLADSYTVSPDGLKYTYKIKDGVKFSDGTPLTANDVAFTFDFLADPHYQDDGQIDISTYGIKGYSDYSTAKADTFKGVKVIDDKTIEFDLDAPNSSALLEIGQTPILSKAYYGKDYKVGNPKPVEDLLNSKPFGSGQYKFVAYKPGQEVDLVANESYFKGAPKVKNLIFKVNDETTVDQELGAGNTDIDMQAAEPEHVSQFDYAGFLNVYTFPTGTSFGDIEFNTKDPVLSDKTVRKAIAYGLDRKQIVESVYKQYAQVINVPVSKASWASMDTGITDYTYNKDKANKLLDEAGWKKGADGIRAKNGVKLEIHFLASTPNSVNDALIPIAKKNFQDLGINFIADQMEFKSVADKVRKHDYQMSFMGAGQTVDPTSDLAQTFKTGAIANDFQYSNTKVDSDIAQAYKETDQTKRKAILANAYKILNDDLPSLPLYQREDVWGINARISGVEPAPYRDLFMDLYKATIK